MTPIDLVKTQFAPMGLNDTQIKGALFLLAGINSFFKVDSSEEEKNKLYDYLEKSKFPEPYSDNDDEIKSSIHEKSNSFFREILNIYDNENKFGIYETMRNEGKEIVELPSPLLFEEFCNQDL